MMTVIPGSTQASFDAVGQRFQQVVFLVTFRAVADAELDAEIDADPDKKHREGNRDRIQRSDHPQPGGGRHRKAGENADQHRHDDARRAERKPQDANQKAERNDDIELPVFLEGAEFLVLDRNWPVSAPARDNRSRA